MVFTLTLKSPSAVPLEVDGVLPMAVAGMSVAEVARLPVLHGNRPGRLGEFFDVTASVGSTVPPADLLFRGDTSHVVGIGRNMTAGFIFCEGPVGRHAGAGMSGGTLILDSACDDWLGAEMSGGHIEVRGRAGHQVGAGYRGSRQGMTGGTIHVRGSAGDELGLRMRRGMIVVGGPVGDFAGAALIAGSVVLLGGVGRCVGAGMKRGTIAVVGDAPRLHPGLAFACVQEPAFHGLIAKSVSRVVGRPIHFGPANCFRGDLTTGGRGELLHFSG